MDTKHGLIFYKYYYSSGTGGRDDGDGRHHVGNGDSGVKATMGVVMTCDDRCKYKQYGMVG